jgi:hypothetical protein
MPPRGASHRNFAGKKAGRLEAVRRIETFPTPEAAKLLLQQGMGSNDEEVSRASFDVLVKFSGDKEICAFLKATVAKLWTQGKPQPETYIGIAVLLTSAIPDVHEEAIELVKDAAQKPKNGRIMLITLADVLANCRGDNAALPLAELMKLPLFDRDFAFRRTVEQALTHVRAKPAVTALIRLLASVKGEVRADIARYLTDISGRQLGLEAGVWSDWWQQNEKAFVFPPEQKQKLAEKVGPRKPMPSPAGPSYYGLPVSGAKIIFVIDTSNSMNGPRIVAAKRELVRAIEGLPGDVEFNVIAFNSRPYLWQSKLVPASGDSKQSAMYFVGALGLATQTASYDALDAALQFDSEVIYFLTDGAPRGGKITSPPDIVQNITQRNQFRRMTINSLGIGVPPPPNVFESFLSSLAQQNFGVYERVDQ